jgi:hypothetical protein
MAQQWRVYMKKPNCTPQSEGDDSCYESVVVQADSEQQAFDAARQQLQGYTPAMATPQGAPAQQTVSPMRGGSVPPGSQASN